jgi:hypothetical protein
MLCTMYKLLTPDSDRRIFFVFFMVVGRRYDIDTTRTNDDTFNVLLTDCFD